ncbi:acetoin dehydrogenase dihydrolipoyllysine-residue acetyltransferase subunit [Streptomyces kanamyceticus]|uniref:Acetoin dehydrogenase dihydrolipoyllysine-residue acetyltransferase subunit n=1 Tax=Streptomyces kanamyceticus TaxID=1967 RepID=A0A5J6GGI9_STRKN|nr:acetoin dehydrogenase dihydrolipoyllysine-residue acetyltransferase subunit [Streptomyces kanamyceticus]QEU95080.1 acetoin dehydrogenase dihydrolipoyllysine-residue acetyltransferase subunit [Streptomyces kanamyceticus]
MEAVTVCEDQVTRVTMPKWGLSMKTGRITEWLAAEGQEVEEGDDLAEIDTDKIAGTLEAPGAGVLRRIVAAAGGDAPVGRVIALIAPAEVPDAEIERLAAEARDHLAAGLPAADEDSPVTGTVRVAGTALAYATSGAGERAGEQETERAGEQSGEPEIVLVHGFGGDKNSWLFVQEPLAAHHTVHALDLPGHGESGKEVGDGGLAALARLVTGFLDALGIGRAHLVGHSLGGAVCVAAAALAPDRVASLTLVAPAGFGPDVDASYLRGFAAAGNRRELRPQLVKLFADESRVTRQLIDDLLKYKRLDGVDRALRTLLDTLLDEDDAPAIDVTDLLRGPAAAVPVVALWGEKDRIIPASNAASLTDTADVRMIPDTGHMPHMETPGEVVRAIEASVLRATP